MLNDLDSPMEAMAKFKSALSEAAGRSSHAFHLMVLSTIGHDGPRSRMLVLRGFVEDRFDLIAYTDRRSEKVKELTANPDCALHFWDAQRKVQIRIQANAELLVDGAEVQRLWDGISDRGRGDYAAANAPGTPLISESVGSWHSNSDEGRKHFCVLSFRARRMDLLQLRREGHMRLCFGFDEEGRVEQAEFVQA